MKTRVILFVFAALIIFTNASFAPVNTKPYTIMVYMNGSDLESEFGAATDDLVEMLDSGLHSRNANVLILTGGAKRWMNDAIPEYEVVLWELTDGWLNEVKSMGKVNMGNPQTLQQFITYSMRNYPAEKFGLIMWDHGGGSIAGFGHDEKFDDDSLSLLDMQMAFENAGLRQNKLEFLGFDACLMATVEMAVLAADYAKYMIASEDLEPGDGWDYVFLNALNRNPRMSGAALGEIIVDTFMDFYGEDSEEILSLSVVDLSRVKPVMHRMGALMARAGEGFHPPPPRQMRTVANTPLTWGVRQKSAPKAEPERRVTRDDLYHANNFHALAARRAMTKTFGEGSPRDNYSDMVDIGDMAVMLSDLFPREADAVLKALDDCVLYNRHNSDVEIYGLSTFYIYGGKSQGVPSLQVYADLDMDKNFTEYLHHFFNRLVRASRNRSNIQFANKDDVFNAHAELALWKPIDSDTSRMVGLLQTTEYDENLLWPKLDGHHVTLFPITKTATTRQYAIPVEANGREADIIVTFTSHYPEGKIMGLRNNAGNVIQKGYDPLTVGDKISIYSLERSHDSNHESWHKGEPFTITADTTLTWETAPKAYECGYRYTNICCDVTYSR